VSKSRKEALTFGTDTEKPEIGKLEMSQATLYLWDFLPGFTHLNTLREWPCSWSNKTCKDLWTDPSLVCDVSWEQGHRADQPLGWWLGWALPGGSFCPALPAELNTSPWQLSCIHGKHQFWKS